jgi:predicted  nucleic acid-binding Zn-ribbon protein
MARFFNSRSIRGTARLAASVLAFCAASFDLDSSGPRRSGAAHASDANGERDLAQITVDAHRIALEAELNERDEIIFPAALLGRSEESGVAKALQDENAAFNVRIRTYRAQIGDLGRQLRLVRIDIKYGEEKQHLIERHIASLQNELDVHNDLAKRGQSLAIDRLNLAQRIVDYSLLRTDLDLQLAKSRDDCELIENRLAEISNQHRNELLAELRETQAHLQTFAEQTSAAPKLAVSLFNSPARQKPAEDAQPF